MGLLKITLLVTGAAGTIDQGLVLAQCSFYSSILTVRGSKERNKVEGRGMSDLSATQNFTKGQNCIYQNRAPFLLMCRRTMRE